MTSAPIVEAAHEDLRPLLVSLAYRMLSSISEAEDVVQEAFLRLHRETAKGTEIESAKAFLTTVTTRLAIDQLRSARARRESYFGPWLPEPLVDELAPDVAQQAATSDSLSMAFLVVLEALSPVERAVFLLREVFDYGYDEIAAIVDKSEANCRQIFVRARRRIDEGKPRFETSREQRDELAQRFLDAAGEGDLAGLVKLLADDAAFYGDGGGKGTGLPRPVFGRDRVAGMLVTWYRQFAKHGVRVRPVHIGGQPGAMIMDADDRLIVTWSFDIAAGAVQTIRGVINPDKLGHLGALSDLGRRNP
jgi:RNA polymerase sigma-70 factor (TIGR02957 family)